LLVLVDKWMSQARLKIRLLYCELCWTIATCRLVDGDASDPTLFAHSFSLMHS
jgi:hypothetical protein